MKSIVICILLALPVTGATATQPPAPEIAWARMYSSTLGGGWDWLYSCTVDSAGYLYVAGLATPASSWDFLTIKYDPSNGDTIWTHCLDYSGGSDDVARSCAVDAFGNLYVTGYTYKGGSYNYLTVKLNAATGDTIWARMYNNAGVAYGDDYGQSCVVDHDGNLYVTGTSYNGTYYNYLTIRYNVANGDTIWTRRNFLAPTWDLKLGMAIDTVANVYIVGATSRNYLIFKLSGTTGDTIWSRRYNGPADGDDRAQGCASDDSGYLYVTGMSMNALNYDYLTIKYNGSGDSLWTRRYNSPTNGYDAANDCAIDGQGNLYVTGVSNSTSSNYLTKVYLAPAYTDSGGLSYDNTEDIAYSCATDNYGNLYVTGTTSTSGPGYHDGLTIKYTLFTGVQGQPGALGYNRTLHLDPISPNPFVCATKIKYQLPKASMVYLAIYNTTGQRVKMIAKGVQNAGVHTNYWNGRDEMDNRVCAGLYFVRLKAGDQQATRKLILVK
jgi:hypothetical protein